MNPNLTFHEFLRYGFCGTTFCGSAFFAGGLTSLTPFPLSTGEGIAIFTALAFVTGAAFYSAYRALLYPYLGRIALGITIWKNFKFRPRHLWIGMIPQAEQQRDEFRWRERENGGKGKPRLDEWASQIHLMYTLGLSLWIGSIVGVTVIQGISPKNWFSWETWNFDYRIGVPFFLLIGSAFLSDLRRRSVEEVLFQKSKRMIMNINYKRISDFEVEIEDPITSGKWRVISEFPISDDGVVLAIKNTLENKNIRPMENSTVTIKVSLKFE